MTQSLFQFRIVRALCIALCATLACGILATWIWIATLFPGDWQLAWIAGTLLLVLSWILAGDQEEESW